jgi:hypothetical protein
LVGGVIGGDGTWPDRLYMAANTWITRIGSFNLNGTGHSPDTSSLDSITMNGPINEITSFNQNPVNVAVQTDPMGPCFNADGTDYAVMQWSLDSRIQSHHDAQRRDSVRANWSDGGAISYTIVPTTNKTYIAEFNTQYFPDQECKDR